MTAEEFNGLCFYSNSPGWYRKEYKENVHGGTGA